MSTYLSIGFVLGLIRALAVLAHYMHDWYQWRHAVDASASIDEFVWLFVLSLFAALLVMVAWPFWIWHKLTEYRQDLK